METKIFFKNSKGEKLCGILNNPTADKTKPIIIMIHGFNSQKNAKNFIPLRDLLTKKNISTFRFDLYAHGESEGQFEKLTISEAVDDVLQAIKFLKKQGYAKIGLVGTSFGGTASLMAASKTKDLFILALKSPISSYLERSKMFTPEKEIRKWKENGFRMIKEDDEMLKLNYTYYKDFKNNDGYKIASLIKIPTIIVHGEMDEFVPVTQSIKISKLIPDCKLVIIKGCDHGYSNPEHLEVMSNAIVDFIFNNINI